MGAISPMEQFTDQELEYIQLAVRRMAPLPHRAEATLFGSVLEKLRDEELRRFRLTLQDRNLR